MLGPARGTCCALAKNVLNSGALSLHNEAPAPSSRRIKELEVMVADVIVETPDTSTLVLFTGNDRLDYKAGHFLTIDPHQFEALDRFTSFLEHPKGRPEPPRAYSMCSAPARALPGGHGEGGTLRPESDEVPTVALAASRQAHRPRHAARRHRFHGTGYARARHHLADRSPRARVRRSGSVPNLSILKFALAHRTYGTRSSIRTRRGAM